MVLQFVENILPVAAIAIELAKARQVLDEGGRENRIFVNILAGADVDERELRLGLIVHRGRRQRALDAPPQHDDPALPAPALQSDGGLRGLPALAGIDPLALLGKSPDRAFDIGGQPQLEQIGQPALLGFAHGRFVAEPFVAAQQGRPARRQSGPRPRDERSEGRDGAGHGVGGRTLLPGPDVMLGLWSSWVDWASRLATGLQANAGSEGWWQVPSDQIMGAALQDSLRQLTASLRKDPILRATEDALNANPLREVIPVDWAEIVRALRTISLLTMGRPSKAMGDAAEFSRQAWQSALDTWNEAAQRWLGMAGSEASPAAKRAAEDRRFAASEWHDNPAYRTLKELYLLASDWLLRASAEAGDMDPAERQWLEFHLRQFVLAMSSHTNPLHQSRRAPPCAGDGRRQHDRRRA